MEEKVVEAVKENVVKKATKKVKKVADEAVKVVKSDTITKKDFDAYCTVQKTREFNMYTDAARVKAGLSRVKYSKIMETYDALIDKYPNVYKQHFGR